MSKADVITGIFGPSAALQVIFFAIQLIAEYHLWNCQCTCQSGNRVTTLSAARPANNNNNNHTGNASVNVQPVEGATPSTTDQHINAAAHSKYRDGASTGSDSNTTAPPKTVAPVLW